MIQIQASKAILERLKKQKDPESPKSCPFCGSKDIYFNSINEICGCGYFKCTKCFSKGPTVEGNNAKTMREKALKKWNRRSI